MQNKKLSSPGPAKDVQAGKGPFPSREPQSERLDSSTWRFYGKGSMGQKAQELYDSQESIEAAGFAPTKRVVLRCGWFDDFERRCEAFAELGQGTAPDRLQELIMAADFSQEEQATLRNILREFQGAPIVVRSSADGDSRGTGVFRSEFCMNDGNEEENLAELEHAVKMVLSSKFSADAIAFRKDTGAYDELAVMIENVFGERTNSTYRSVKRDDEGNLMYDGQGRFIKVEKGASWFAPDLSGCGYTSTPSGNGFVVLTSGLPTEAVSGEHNMRVELSEDNASEDIIYLEVFSRFNRASFPSITRVVGDVLLLSGPPGWRGLTRLPGMLYNKEDGAKPEKEMGIGGVELGPLYSKLKELERLAGKPLYVEFAMRRRDGKEEYAILQISEMRVGKEIAEFPSEPKDVLAESRGVIGEGKVTCDGIVVCPAPDFIRGGAAMLEEYNETHSGYLLIIDSSFFSSMRFNIPYSHFNNASAVIAQRGWDHRYDGAVTQHFQGLFSETDKLFMEANWGAAEAEGGLLHELGIFGGPGLLKVILDKKVEVIVSEHQQRGMAMLVRDD